MNFIKYKGYLQLLLIIAYRKNHMYAFITVPGYIQKEPYVCSYNGARLHTNALHGDDYVCRSSYLLFYLP